MCGYIGQISNNTFNRNNIDLANKIIECRGPDDTQIMSSFEENFSLQGFDQYFVFNRLAIVDLNKNAMQPMYANETQSLILFNGEIFNHKILRSELESKGINFKTSHSDTEVLLKGLSFFGVDFVKKLNGQFSIVFINYKEQKIYLIRDRMGQKPLFYYYDNNNIIFSSNLKSIIKTNIKNFEIDDYSFKNYINYGVVPSPKTIFKNIFKVKPAEYITFQVENNIIKKINSEKYWDIDEFSQYSEKLKLSELSKIINEAISIRQSADVPVANYLSGGVDSSFLVKSLSKNNKPINTFSATYEDLKYDESIWSQRVATKYKTVHYSNKISNDEINKSIDSSILLFDEPYSDPSTLPSYLLAKSISKKFKVAVSGDGGDELFIGYERVINFLEKKKIHSNLFNFLYSIYPPYLGTGASILKEKGFTPESYALYFSDKKFLKFLEFDDMQLFETQYFSTHKSDLKAMLITDYKFYFQEMMMLKIDRTSMANSLEVRSPFLDHNLVEYILSRDDKDLYTIKNKKFLKDDLITDFDSDFVNRKKMGFVFNLEDWIYENKDKIINSINDSLISNLINISKIKFLFNFKTRVNSQRIWKIYFLSVYFDDLT